MCLTRRVQETPGGSNWITIPKHLVTMLGIKKGDDIRFEQVDGYIILSEATGNNEYEETED